MADSEYGRAEGRQLAQNLASGIDEASVEAVTSLENVYVKLETISKNADVNARNLAKKQRKRELKNLKNALDLELMTEEEYYARLTEYRDKNLSRGSDDWYKYTEEIVKYNKRMADAVKAQQQEMLEEAERMQQRVLQLQNQLAEKLKADNAPWYKQVTEIFRGVGSRGRNEIYRTDYLTDFGTEIELLEKYRDAVMGLKNLGNIPNGVFDDISQMSVEEGLRAAQSILSAAPEARSRFIEGYSAREKLADGISAQLNPILNRELLQEAGIYSAEAFNSAYFSRDDGEKTEFVKLLEQSFESVPESYRTLGGQSAGAFADGFSEALPDLMSKIRAALTEQMNSLASSLASGVKSSVMSTSSGSVTNNTFTFNSSRDTTTQQLRAAKHAAALKRLRGGE